MDFVRDMLGQVVDQGHRAAVDLLHGYEIDSSAPYSPDVPEDLRSWLPDLFDRFPLTFPWSKPHSVDPALHNVWIMDNTAFRSPESGEKRPGLSQLADPNIAKPRLVSQPGQGPQSLELGNGKWEVEFVAAFFVKNSGKGLAHALGTLVKQLNIADDDVATKKRIAARLEPFIDQVLPDALLRISIDSTEEQTLGPSNYSGISSGLHELHFSPSSSHITSNALNVPPPFGLPSTTVLSEPEGWGVISDIDDTIKVTQTPNALGILRNTFVVEDLEPIAGMPELYAHMQQVLDQSSNNTPSWFYLSASPYNLYPFLRRFRDAHYPQGTIILRDASWQNLGGLITSLQNGTKEYKDNRISKIHSWLPYRKMICIGDSTQTDPEAYGEAARKYPGWIKAIFIRKVTNIALMDEDTKNAPQRFEKAFKGLDQRLWHVFTDPSELTTRVDELSKNGDALVGGE